jgi:5'-nucleotidase
MFSIRRVILLSILAISACGRAEPGVDSNGILTFIHLNDTYRVDAVEEGRRGGFSRIATLVRSLQADGNDVRILHGGDFLYPSLESQLWNGKQMVEAMNFLDDLAPLYAVPGNHEFDPRTTDALIERVRESRFDRLGDNLRLNTGEDDVDQSMRTAFTFESGDKTVGVFALTVHPDHGGNVRDHTPFLPGTYVEHAERVIDELERQGVDLIIGVTHLHLGDDMEVAKLKARHPKFMFIVGGHEHEPEYLQGSEGNAAVMKGRRVKKLMRPVDGSISISRPTVPDNKRIDSGKSLAPDSTGTAAHCPCLDDCAPHDSG